MDGLKKINDTQGHREGSEAIKRISEILRETFRESDIVARLGGNEFAVLARDIDRKEAELMESRLQERLRESNLGHSHGYELSLSVGLLCVQPERRATVEELLAQTDQLMYESKRLKLVSPVRDNSMKGSTNSFRCDVA
jgi:diguanylate cyclase (GGDEF)-like protein